MEVPEIRITACNEHSIRKNGRFVLYWMIANRRLQYNFSLQRAIEHANELGKPLVVFEALRCDYRWASDRLHRFVLQGMAANKARCATNRLCYYPYVEPKKGADRGLLDSLAKEACVIVTDDFPTFFLPRMVKLVSKQVSVLVEKVDSNGLLPMYATEKVYPTAYAFRRYLQKELPKHLLSFPKQHPLQGMNLPAVANELDEIQKRWPPATDEMLGASPEVLSALPIDHEVKPGSVEGGSEAAESRLKDFLSNKLERYGEDRNHPDEDIASGFSPYLHFGHLSAHEIFEALAEQEDWTPERLSNKTSGKREDWWNMSAPAEAFLDELITWRELGYNMAALRSDYDQYDTLPGWARETLEEHESDSRTHIYRLEDFEKANTHDPLWNAAQNQLVQEGRLHNYLRMLWGKKIFEWSNTPRDALKVMIELNNKYAIDGRNPNSYSGIFWVLGRYDRAWGPERSVYGKIRYMKSESTMKKLRLKEYMRKYSPDSKNAETLF